MKYKLPDSLEAIRLYIITVALLELNDLKCIKP